MDQRTEGEVLTTIDRSIATIVFSHPKANSLPRQLLLELSAAFYAAAADPEIRVVVLSSQGSGSFCAGASFAEFQAIDSIEAAEDFFLGVAEVLLAMRACPKLVIGRVQGKAVGGGVGLVAACDYVFATQQAAVRLSEFELGIGPFTIGPAVERKVGVSRFAELSIDCRWRDAGWARDVGLYADVLESEAMLDTAVHTLATEIVGRSASAATALKQMLWSGTEQWDQLMRERAAVSAELLLQSKQQDNPTLSRSSGKHSDQ